MNMKHNIVLTGFMGAGKTSLGKAVSRILEVPFLDTDDLIVQAEGMPVSEIFQTKGEAYFRALETETVCSLSERTDRYVLSVGGGLVMRRENWAYLHQAGLVVYLKVGIDTLKERLAKDTKRPLLHQGEGSLEEKIVRLLAAREPVYEAAADVVFVNDYKPFQQAAREIASLAVSD